MTTSIDGILQGITTRLATISGMEVREFMPPTPTTPMAVPALGPIHFDEAMGRGLDHYEFSILVLVDRADAETATSNLIAYANPTGSSSVKAALEGGTPARTLGGVVSTCAVTDMKDPGVVEFGGLQIHGGTAYLFVEFTLEVHTR